MKKSKTPSASRVLILSLVILAAIIAMAVIPRRWVNTEAFTEETPPEPESSPPPDPSPPPVVATSTAPTYNNNNNITINSPPSREAPATNAHAHGHGHIDDDYYARRRSTYPYYYDSVYAGPIVGPIVPSLNNYWWWPHNPASNPYSYSKQDPKDPKDPKDQGRDATNKDVATIAIAAAVGSGIALVISVGAFSAMNMLQRSKKK